jgi:hypothetical protein
MPNLRLSYSRTSNYKRGDSYNSQNCHSTGTHVIKLPNQILGGLPRKSRARTTQVLRYLSYKQRVKISNKVSNRVYNL